MCGLSYSIYMHIVKIAHRHALKTSNVQSLNGEKVSEHKYIGRRTIANKISHLI